jgi:predicted peptidase
MLIAACAAAMVTANCAHVRFRSPAPLVTAQSRARDSLARRRDSLSHADVDGFTARWLRGADGALMPYRLFIPKERAPGVRYPLMVWLHGAGGMGGDNLAQISGDQKPGTHTWTDPATQAAHPAFVLVPQNYGKWQFVEDTVLAPDDPLGLVSDIVRAVAKEFPIDSGRIYLGGQSLGGGGAWALITSDTNPFAAAIILCPYTSTIQRSSPVLADLSHVARVSTMPIWLFQGDADYGLVPYTRAMVAALRSAGGHPRYTEYPGAGHDIWNRVFQEPELVTWLFAQRKERTR